MRQARFAIALLLCMWLASPARAPRSASIDKAQVIRIAERYISRGDIYGLARFGDFLYEQHCFEGLLELCQYAVKRLEEPEQRALAMRGVGEAYQALEQWDKAYATYRQVIREYPQSLCVPWAHLGMAACLIGEKQHAQAASMLRDTIEQWPDQAVAAWAWERLGYCFLRLGRLDEAEAAIERAIEGYDPEHYTPIPGFPQVLVMRRYLAVPDLYEVYAAAKKPRVAAAELERIRNAHADVEGPATFWLAKSLQLIGEDDRAAREYERYVSYGRKKEYDYRATSMLNAGICRMSVGRRDEALAHWKELVEDQPRSPEADEARRLLANAGVQADEPPPPSG